ncbi:uncharacterized protein LOC126407083 [Epinephelus moara]|uniref:uncharacterized protein LOC126407083 n=1 Tax=Epinephelus moara TaxID=300413 RepID=UPI00214F48F2|nr:uncharacterized protein LOC126407083 [Epinephelus moara]
MVRKAMGAATGQFIMLIQQQARLPEEIELLGLDDSRISAEYGQPVKNPLPIPAEPRVPPRAELPRALSRAVSPRPPLPGSCDDQHTTTPICAARRSPHQGPLYQYSSMTSSMTCTPPVLQPPLMLNPSQSLFNSADNSQRALPGSQPLFETPGPGMATREWGSIMTGEMAGQGNYNQPSSNINLYDMAQPGPSQVKNLWEGHPGNVAPPPSQYMTPKVPEPQPTPMMSQPLQSDCTEDKWWMAPLSCPSSETASSSEDVPETDAEGPLPPLTSYSPTSPPVNEPQPKPDPPQPVPVNAHTPLPQTPMSQAIRAWLQQDYKVSRRSREASS